MKNQPDNDKLKSECKRLKKMNAEKDVIISALIDKIKKKSHKRQTEKQDISNDEIDNFAFLEKKEYNDARNIINSDRSLMPENKMIEEANPIINIFPANLAEESPYARILDILANNEREEKCFKQSYDFNTFIHFVSETEIAIKDKKQITKYIDLNKKGILKTIFDNIENLDLTLLYNTLLIVVPCLDINEKYTLMHDIIIYNCKTEWLTVLLYIVINSESNWNGKLFFVIKEIFSYQLILDMEFCKDIEKIFCFYTKIQTELSIPPKTGDFSAICENLIYELDVFVNGKINSTIFENVMAIKLLCFYMDWDFTYNSVICDLLGNRLKNDSHPACIFYLGALTVTGIKMVGEDSSIKELIKTLENYLDSKNIVVGAVAYMFLKQIKMGNKESWIIGKKTELESALGIQIEILKEFIC